MQQIQIFKYEDDNPLDFTTVDRDGEVWFVAADVCKLLGIVNVSDALSTLEEDEKLVSVIPRSGQNRPMGLVNESGLYNLIFRSKKASAVRFRRWVTRVVLPTIRKTGSYDGINRIEMPNFVKRFNDNYMRVESGYFSVISELFIILQGRFEQIGYQIPDKAFTGKEIRPDVSVGMHFARYVSSESPIHDGLHKMYMHKFTNGLELEARQYPDDLLVLFRRFVTDVWLPKYAYDYFQCRDRKALEYLPKLLKAA